METKELQTALDSARNGSESQASMDMRTGMQQAPPVHGFSTGYMDGTESSRQIEQASNSQQLIMPPKEHIDIVPTHVNSDSVTINRCVNVSSRFLPFNVSFIKYSY